MVNISLVSISLLCQHGFHVLLEVFRLGGGSKALHGLAILRDEELGEVPLDVAVLLHALADGLEERLGCLSLQAVVVLCGRLCFQVFEDRLSIRAVHVALLHDLERHAVVQLAELLYLGIALGVLLLELVAGEADDDQSAVPILLIEFLQSGELRREAALAGSVDDEQHLSPERSKVHLFASARQSLEIIDCLHSCDVIALKNT